MGINPYVKKEEKQESDLDKVLKGLQVAGNVFGIYTDYKKLGQMKADEEMKKSERDLNRQYMTSKETREEAQEKREQEKHDALKATGFRAPKDPFTQAYQQDRMQSAKEDRTNKTVERLQTKLSPLQEIQNAVSSVENKMGFTLDQYDPATNKANGQEVDLPGVSVPLLGRVTAYSSKARDLDTSMARVFNTELKDRSGAAVTTPELNRLRQEFGEGKFNTEQEKLAALKDYQRAATIAMRNVEAGFAPDAVGTYSERGGMTSKNLSDPFKGAVSEEQINAGLQGGNKANASPLDNIKLDDIDAELQRRQIKKKGLSGTLPGKKQ